MAKVNGHTKVLVQAARDCKYPKKLSGSGTFGSARYFDATLLEGEFFTKTSTSFNASDALVMRKMDAEQKYGEQLKNGDMVMRLAVVTAGETI